MLGNVSEKEEKLLTFIRQNPYISQQELADLLNVSRPTVANMISSLMKKERIVGRAYVLANDDPIVCVGGANIDRKFYIKEKVQLQTSNPTKSSQSAGGVARNIGENLGRLGASVALITCAGRDSDWNFIKDSSPYINFDYVKQLEDASTGSYTAVLDQDGELVIALADMEVYENITPALLENYDSLLKRSRCIVADLNSPKETIEYLQKFSVSHEKPFMIVPVSSPKMQRLPRDLTGVTWLIANRDETETFFQMEIKNREDWEEAVKKWLHLGVQNIVVTNGSKGAILGNEEEIIHIPAKETTNIVDVTGAGDAFSSAVIFTWLEGKTLRQIGEAATMNANKTLQSPFTVRQDLSAAQLLLDMEEL